MMSEEFPLIAIVTPVYNGARYLTETMECVQAQTYPNLIHVVLDNASTDETPEIIESFKERRIPVFSTRNDEVVSQQANWEKAIRLMPPEAAYFFVLCADDLMTADAIERLATVAVADPAVGLIGSQLGEGGTPSKPDEVYCKGLPEDRAAFDGRWALKTYFIHFHEALSPTHTLIRADYLTDENPFYDEHYLAFDSEVCLRLMLKSKYGFVHAPIAWRRVHENSISTMDANDEMNMKEWFEWLERFGPLVMSADELALCRRTHLRHHFRRLFLWRFKTREKAKYERHLAFLKSCSVQPSLSDYAGALFEWAKLALLNRRHEIGAVRSLWPRAEAELQALDLDQKVAYTSIAQGHSFPDPALDKAQRKPVRQV